MAQRTHNYHEEIAAQQTDRVGDKEEATIYMLRKHGEWYNEKESCRYVSPAFADLFFWGPFNARS